MDLKSLTPKDLIYIQPNENGGQITDLIYIYIYIQRKNVKAIYKLKICNSMVLL